MCKYFKSLFFYETSIFSLKIERKILNVKTNSRPETLDKNDKKTSDKMNHYKTVWFRLGRVKAICSKPEVILQVKIHYLMFNTILIGFVLLSMMLSALTDGNFMFRRVNAWNIFHCAFNLWFTLVCRVSRDWLAYTKTKFTWTCYDSW